LGRGVKWNGMNGLESLSREELIALAVELRQTVAEQGERIALLEAELERRGKGADGTNAPHFVPRAAERRRKATFTAMRLCRSPAPAIATIWPSRYSYLIGLSASRRR